MAERRFGQLKVPELDSPRLIGAGTQFRRVPPYFDHCVYPFSFSVPETKNNTYVTYSSQMHFYLRANRSL